jgi:hypothetical protein
MDLPCCVHEARLATRRTGLGAPDGAENLSFAIDRKDLGAWNKFLGEQASRLLHTAGEGHIRLDIADFIGILVYAAHPKASPCPLASFSITKLISAFDPRRLLMSVNI